MAFPKPRCPLCSRWNECRNTARIRKEYPSCQSPLLPINIRRASQLLDMIMPASKAAPSSMRKNLITWIDRYNGRYSEVFEPSLSFDSDGIHAFRFSYAFAGFKDEPGLLIQEIKRLAGKFGTYPYNAIQKLEPAMNSSFVKQPIIGLAWDSSNKWRFKFYLQFAEHAGEHALKLTQAIVNDYRLTKIFMGKSLRLLGLDLGPDGMKEAKLYFHVPDFKSLDRPFLPTDENHLLNWMALHGFGPPCDLLSIHRLTSPGDPGLESPKELDFSLIDSELLLDDLRGNPDILRMLSFPLVKKIFQEFRLAARRISVSSPSRNKMNLYYVLAETEKS